MPLLLPLLLITFDSLWQSTGEEAALIASAHAAMTSAFWSRPVKCRAVRRAPVWTEERELVKI